MSSRNEEPQNQHQGSSDEMDELQAGTPEANRFPTAAEPRVSLCSSLQTLLRDELPPSPPRASSSATYGARSSTSRRALERRVEALKAERDREVREKRAILDENRKLKDANASLVSEAQRSRAEKAQMKQEIQNLKSETRVMQTEKELQKAEVRYRDDVIERLKGVLRRHHLL
ncbi:uncharacterized protein FFUJ_09037 [Fusarium fujikuroi IMI 58289]|uniref:BZIP domain-containing protein n=1 Tax=Gibberella fujikuroi (strain CBS 195.34 / IMI 58289 / NRRL A-6831) TaxID=1279085 RepID=S0E7U1_GIBF5|nr:uncharacterized protein FFUJ_09037 [Fusarium fujikuroi IMI 58289]KLP21989.1 uncharacterized protein LW94_7137 [Fusarium fujikuroi]QGI66655.1 hypothetical protein CEK27_010626 [Fusarium fujikuroi]QGI83893.1 hypothetical protein CEK25_010622 [Fusarium fujikuroi]QGI97545.1 hypothetical protein CEK26_010614 [Fusarium fujikuroi]CCT70936.1 uncharacterized protein FFUJ_09037 [Fusarium fujikuroi IMI 58289]